MFEREMRSNGLSVRVVEVMSVSRGLIVVVKIGRVCSREMFRVEVMLRD